MSRVIWYTTHINKREMMNVRIKKERFVIIFKIHTGEEFMDIVGAEFDNYPSDEELEREWNLALNNFYRVYHYKVEKQGRFE